MRCRSAPAGFSLPIVLVALGIFAAIGPVLYGIVASAVDQYSKASRGRMAQQFIDELSMKMLDPRLCSPILRGQVVSLAGGPSFPLPAQNIRLDLGGGVFVQNGSFLPLMPVQMDQVQIQVKSQAMLSPIEVRQVKYDWPLAPAANVFDKYYADVIIAPKNTPWSIKDRRHIFEIALIINPVTKQIHQCHTRPSPAEGCEAIGGAFDATGKSPPGLECNPNVICFSHPVLVGGVPSGVVTNPAMCDNLYQGPFQNQVKSLYKPVALGSIPVGAVTQTTYMCMWCNRWPK